jgi:hypothetical protein
MLRHILCVLALLTFSSQLMAEEDVPYLLTVASKGDIETALPASEFLSFPFESLPTLPPAAPSYMLFPALIMSKTFGGAVNLDKGISKSSLKIMSLAPSSISYIESFLLIQSY